MCSKSYCTTPGIKVRVEGISRLYNFTFVFYMMGKILSGELSCTWAVLVTNLISVSGNARHMGIISLEGDGKLCAATVDG